MKEETAQSLTSQLAKEAKILAVEKRLSEYVKHSVKYEVYDKGWTPSYYYNLKKGFLKGEIFYNLNSKILTVNKPKDLKLARLFGEALEKEGFTVTIEKWFIEAEKMEER